jgi:uncharacterized heparinase superfamily protein
MLYVRTARHLRPVQVVNRIWRRLYRPTGKPGEIELRAPTGQFLSGVEHPASLLGPSEVCFLNERGSLASAESWNDAARPKLWLYQLHYFDDLCAVGARTRHQWQRHLITRWIHENPPGAGIGWEPYPLSLRVCNWIKWHLAGNSLDAAARANLVQQVRHLVPRLEHHLLGNHLLENLKALIFAGCFFAGKEADWWRERGLKALEDQVAEQILEDGAHFEVSPMYHGLVFEDLLDVLNVLSVYGFVAPCWLHAACAQMAAWSACMAHPDGEWPQFNDTALGIAARPDDLIAYHRRLGGRSPAMPSPTTILNSSGFVRAARGNLVLFADVGNLGPDYNPAHGHADTFTFELSYGEDRLIVDTGISTYEVGPTRALQRSTRAHNTVEIDGANSSEVWSAFRVARRAKVRNLTVVSDQSSVTVAAEHDGYYRLSGHPVHRREWRLTARGIDITDSIRSFGKHDLRAHLHLHPNFRASVCGAGAVQISGPTGQHIATIECGNWSSVGVEPYEHAPQFGRLSPADKIVMSHRSSATCELRSMIRVP